MSALMALHGVARADTGDVVPAPATEPAGAKAWFATGSAHHKAGEFVLAAEAYEEAHRLEPHPVYLLNAAIAREQGKEWGRAASLYERFLAADPTTSFKADVEGRLPALRALAAVPVHVPAIVESGHGGAAAAASTGTTATPAAGGIPPHARAKSRLGLGLALGFGAGVAASALAVAVTLLATSGRGVDAWVDRHRDVTLIDQRGLWSGR